LDCNLAAAGTCFIPAETLDEPASTRFGQRDPLQRVRKSDRGFARAKRKSAGHRDNSSFFPKNGRTACPLALGTAVAASKTESLEGEDPCGRKTCPVRTVDLQGVCLVIGRRACAVWPPARRWRNQVERRHLFFCLCPLPVRSVPIPGFALVRGGAKDERREGRNRVHVIGESGL